jgi:FkbM family methyltransferase
MCYLSRLLLFVCLMCVVPSWSGEAFHSVEKKGVTYRFSKEDLENDHFVTYDFPQWEEETFDVFDQVKDPEGIAIDIGAWIGTTAIWLSKNFNHVVAVEADKKSLESLERNLAASECQNVTVCPFPVAESREDVFFGPRGSRLNESISCMKSQPDSPLDYVVKSLTFKQILFDHVYSNESLNGRKISFIKCDIEGGEEAILEDVLHFAYNNKVPVYMSFHLDWWRSKEIDSFKYLFKYFETGFSSDVLCSHIRANPFCSILFTPKQDEGVLVKKNMTAVVIGYNQPTYIKNMVRQLEKYTSDIVVIDNNSSSISLFDYYNNEFKHTLLRMGANFGYTVYLADSVQKLVGDVYVLTDPDLQFSSQLPQNFIQQLVNVSNHFESSHVGFALLIDADDLRLDLTYGGRTILEWEQPYWTVKLPYPPDSSLELYEAPIDTTFCLINRRFSNPHIRVGGNYTCKHLPWHTNYKSFLEEGEYQNYLQDNISTCWFREEPQEEQ